MDAPFQHPLSGSHIRQGSIWHPKEEAAEATPAPAQKPDYAGLYIEGAEVLKVLDAQNIACLAVLADPNATSDQKQFQSGVMWEATRVINEIRRRLRDAAVDRIQQEEQRATR